MTQILRPEVKLIGTDGNAFAIIGACMKAAYDANWPEEDIKKAEDEMTSGDYSNLLSVACKYFEVS